MPAGRAIHSFGGNILPPVFRIGGPNRLDRLDRLRGPVQSSLFGGPGRPVYGQWTAWTACVTTATCKKANMADNKSRDTATRTCVQICKFCHYKLDSQHNG